MRPYSAADRESAAAGEWRLLKHEITRRRSRANEQILEPRPHRALAFGIPGPVDVRRIRQQQQYAALAVFGQRVQIEQLVVGRRGIHFEIAGVNDHAQRRRDRQRHALTIECVTRMNSIEKDPRVSAIPRLYGDELGFVEQFVLFQPPLDQRQREFGSVNRHIQLRQQKRHAADVVLMAVRENQAADHARVLLQVAEVRRDDIDAQQFRFGKHHARIDDDNVVAVAERHGVHPELAESSNGHYL